MTKKIVFIIGALSQPRCIKRVSAFHKVGYECVVYGYERGNYVNKYPEGVKVNIWGIQKDGTDHIKKFQSAWSDITKIIKQYKKEDVLFYSFGFINALIFLIKRAKYIYEISDILYAYPAYKRVVFILKKLDMVIIKQSYKTVMTSLGFYNYYGLKDENIIVIPNKVNPRLNCVCQRAPLCLTKDSIRFAFIGGIRYHAIARFAEVIGKYFPQHSFYFYGACSPAIQKEINFDVLISKYDNLHYWGAFKSPDDLPSIYRGVDVVVACYDINSLNERIAEPNKLYEAMFFCRPIVVSDGIFLGERVKQLHCGFTLDAATEQNIINFISSLKPQNLNYISEHEYNMPLSEMVDNTEELIAHLI